LIVDAVPTDIELAGASSDECVTVNVSSSEHVGATVVSFERISRARVRMAF
jgi:hypothetical protein